MNSHCLLFLIMLAFKCLTLFKCFYMIGKYLYYHTKWAVYGMVNQKFNILSALGIILVVGGHSGVGFLPWFPPYSFHMPLFIFISGYFFSSPPPPTNEFSLQKKQKIIAPVFRLECILRNSHYSTYNLRSESTWPCAFILKIFVMGSIYRRMAFCI